MIVSILRPRGEELVGIIPQFLSTSDPRPAAEQFNESYAHGGGWSPMSGWRHSHQPDKGLTINYPGDPALRPVAVIALHDEKIWVYENAWVAIEQPDGSVEISRMD